MFAVHVESKFAWTLENGMRFHLVLMKNRKRLSSESGLEMVSVEKFEEKKIHLCSFERALVKLLKKIFVLEIVKMCGCCIQGEVM